jgi:signal peptidase I
MDSLKKEEGIIKKGFKKFWFLLWKDNSIKGWLFSLIFLFVFIKFIFFPFLNLVTGTSLPLAIVESCSMYHQGNVFSNFDDWFDGHQAKYESINITKEEFLDFIFKRGFSKGDILFIMGANPDKLEIGNVILFKSGNKNTPVIHRIINIQEKNGKRIFTTMGDNNAQILTPSNNPGGVDEREITEEQLVGKAVFRIAPGIGWIKLIFFEGSRSSSERGFCTES